METRKINPALDQPITTAVETGDRDKVLDLLAQDANPNAIVYTFQRNKEFHALDEEEKHLLHLAVELDSIEILEILLKQGANPALKSSDGLTAIDLAIRQHNVYAISTFAKFVPLRPSILGEALWHVLAYHSENCLAIVKTLLEEGADPNISRDFAVIRESQKEPLSSLSLAARYCAPEVTTLLLQYGASLIDLNIKNEKKQKAFENLFKAVSAVPNFEKEKQDHHAERDAAFKKAEALELEHQQRQETRRLADVQNQIDAFVKIYTALRDGQSGLVKTNFLKNLNLLISPDDKLSAIIIHARKQGSRTAKALELAQQYGSDCNNKNVDLIAHIYNWSYHKSGLFKKSCVSGITLFGQKGGIAVQMIALMRDDELSQFADNNTHSRTAKILRALS